MKNIRWLKVAVFLACLEPLVALVWGWRSDTLGANPIEVITRSTGTWTLVFLMVTLAITPLRRIAGAPWLIRFRRMTGLFAFFYGCLHFAIYLGLDRLQDFLLTVEGQPTATAFLGSVLKDVAKRPFITAGFTAFVLMVPLALTSTQGWIRRLGGSRWRKLHWLIYISAIAGVVHFWWLVKADVREPLIYAAVLTVLLGYRVVAFARSLQKSPQPLPRSRRATAD